MAIIKMLTTLIPEEVYEEVSAKSTYNMADAANALQWHIYEGICDNLNTHIELINMLPIGSFPQYYKDPFVRQKKFGNLLNVGFCNVKLVRKIVTARKVAYEILKVFEGVEDGVLLVYSMSVVFMDVVRMVKKKRPDIIICTIVADLPNITYSTDNNVLKKVFVKYQARRAYRAIGSTDLFVLLTKQMAQYMNLNQPYCIVEGISTDKEEYTCNKVDTENPIKTIMYTGTLHKKFGIISLLNAFKTISKDNYRLLICGVGDSEQYIKEEAKKDSRIQFLGQLPRKEVLKLQSQATVLINPRPNNETFTKYSFPSKTMEYLSAGKPVIAYKLDGIPEEYNEFLNSPVDESVEELAIKIIEICEMPAVERETLGIRGRKFVLENKNAKVQTQKILDMIVRYENNK